MMSLWINGEWQSGHGPARSKHNPVSQALLWQGNDADAGQVALAVSAARGVSCVGASAVYRPESDSGKVCFVTGSEQRRINPDYRPGDRQTALGSGHGN